MTVSNASVMELLTMIEPLTALLQDAGAGDSRFVGSSCLTSAVFGVVNAVYLSVCCFMQHFKLMGSKGGRYRVFTPYGIS